MFHLPDGMRQPKALAILYVYCPDGNPGWASVPAVRRRWRCVQAVVDMGDWSVKCKWTPCQKQKYKKEGMKISVLADVGYTANILLWYPFWALGDTNL